MKVYIAGKISGDENYREKFEVFAQMERDKGHVVLNPAVLPLGLTEADYMRIDLAMLDCADIVYFLPDYQESEGAMLELAYCKRTGKEHAFYQIKGRGSA